MGKPKNEYLARQAADRMDWLNAGVEIGRQQIVDYVCLALAKEFGFGKDRCMRVIYAVRDFQDEYREAFLKSDEADYKQEKLDAALKQVLQEKFDYPFGERYPYIAKFNYKKGGR